MRVVLLAVGFVACAGAPPPVAPTPVRETVGTSEPEGPLCELAGESWSLPLRTTNGIHYGDVVNADGRGRLERSGSELIFVGEIEREGWRLATHDHPTNNPLFRLTDATRFGEVVTALVGTEIVVGDAEPGRLEVELPGSVLNDASLRMLSRASAHVTCDRLTLSHPRPSGPPSTSGELATLRSTDAVPVAAGPGLAPLVELVPRDRAIFLRRVEEREGWSHVVRRGGGIEVDGWVESTALEAYDDGVAESMLLGALGGGAGTVEVCRSNDDLDLRVRRAADGIEADVGVLSAGTPFVRVNGQSEDMQVQPHPDARVTLRGGVTMWTSARAPLECRVETPNRGILGVLGGGGGLGGVLSALPRRVPHQPAGSLRVRVTRVRGLSGVRRGSTCTIDLTHGSNCRAEIQCGQHTLFGETSRLGFFPCEYQANPLRVVGEDTTPTEPNGNGDAAMRLDTDAGTLTVQDSADGHIGEYELEARIVQSTPP